MISEDIFSGLTPINATPSMQEQNTPDIFEGLQPIESQESRQGFGDVLSGALNQGARYGMLGAKGLALAQPEIFIPELAIQAQTALEGTETKQEYNVRNAAIDAIKSLQEKKAFGQWSEGDEQRLKGFYDILEMPAEQMKKEKLFIEPSNLSPTSIFREAGKLAGVDTEARNIPEKAVEFGFMMAQNAGSAIAKAESFLPQKATEKMSRQVIDKAKQAMKTYPIIGPAAVIEATIGWPMEAGLVVMGLAEAGAKLGEHIVSQTGKKWFLFDPNNVSLKDFWNSIKQEQANAPKYLAEQVEKGIMKAKDAEAMLPFLEIAEKNNIPVTPTTIANSRYFRNMEKIVSTNEMTAEQLSAFNQKVAEDWAKVSEKSLKNIATDLQFSTPGSTAEALMTDVTRKHQMKLIDEYSNLYGESAQELSKTKNISPESYKEIEDSLNRVTAKIGESLIPTTAESSAKSLSKSAKKNLTVSPRKAGKPELEEVNFPTGKELKALEEKQAGIHVQQRKGFWAQQRAKGMVKGAAERETGTLKESQKELERVFPDEYKNMRLDENGNIRFTKPINGKTLVNTVRSLNNIIEWENPGVVNLFNDTRKTLKNILQKEYGVTNKHAIQKYDAANKKFGQSADLFGKQSKWKKWGIDTESTSEELLQTINSKDKLKLFEKDFGDTAEGKNYIDHFKHLKAREILDPVFDKRTYSPGDVANAVHKLKRNKYFEYIVPEQSWKNLEDIQKLDALIERRSKAIYEHKPIQDKDRGVFLSVWKEIQKKTWGYVKDLSKDQRAAAFSEYFLDPSYTKNMKTYLTEITNQLGKSKPNKGIIRRNMALIENIGNDLSQIAIASTVQGNKEKE